MAVNPPTPTPDNTTQVLGLAVAAMTVLAALINRFPMLKKKDTGEHRALRMIEDRDETIANLERQRDEREAELMKAEKEVNTLRVVANEVETLRAANSGLVLYNQQLAKELEDLRKRMDLS